MPWSSLESSPDSLLVPAYAWSKLSDKQKARYQKKYEMAKTQFEKDMAAFIAAGSARQRRAK